jgi:hypothetical protein
MGFTCFMSATQVILQVCDDSYNIGARVHFLMLSVAFASSFVQG